MSGLNFESLPETNSLVLWEVQLKLRSPWGWETQANWPQEEITWKTTEKPSRPRKHRLQIYDPS